MFTRFVKTVNTVKTVICEYVRGSANINILFSQRSMTTNSEKEKKKTNFSSGTINAVINIHCHNTKRSICRRFICFRGPLQGDFPFREKICTRMSSSLL